MGQRGKSRAGRPRSDRSQKVRHGSEVTRMSDKDRVVRAGQTCVGEVRAG